MITLNQLIEGIKKIQERYDCYVNICGQGDGNIYLEVTEKKITIKQGRFIDLN
jgi:hypothetical protein